ncbi:sensor histidine kinase [Streptomyces sp. NPDC058001]|uniref:sensor histidine kinase n=1 Tax=Streptomyces sp. NPDC058001 TaxID=3346300 RepID=UPI0036E9786C
MSTTSTPPEPRGHESRPSHDPPRPAVRQRAGVVVRGWLLLAGEVLTTPSGSTGALMSGAPRRWMRSLPYLVALGFVAALIPTTTLVLTNDYGIDGSLAGAFAVAQAAPLLLAVSRPLPAWWIVIIADVLGAVVVVNTGEPRPAPWAPPIILGYVVLCLTLSLRERRRTLIGVWLVTAVAGLILAAFTAPGTQDTSLLLIVLSGAVLLLGTLLRERGEARRKLVEQETISEAERSQRTLLEERARIARELHDMVAHHMSVISVQADSAPYRLQGLSPAVVREFESIAAGARESLGEMRRLLSVLRSEDAHGERAPQPGLDRLRQLADATVRAGVPVEMSVPEIALVKELAKVSPAVDLSAYRIVQEALANVVRHAPGARTELLVSTDCEHVMIIVVNAPAPRRAAPLESGGTGHGLVGMAERVRLIGGTLDVGPLPDGGFRVAARLPVVEPGGAAPPDGRET